MWVSYATGARLSGLLFFVLTVLSPLGSAGCLFRYICLPSAFAFFFFAAFSFTRLMNSSRLRLWRTCSVRTLMRFSM